MTIDGKKLKDAITASHYNVTTVSKILGKAPCTLNNTLVYGKRIGADDLQKICILLNKDMDEFLTNDDTMEQTSVTQPIMATAEQADRIIFCLKSLSITAHGKSR